MISNRVDQRQPVTPFLLRFAQRLRATSSVQAAPDDETGTRRETLPGTRLTKVRAEPTDDA